MSEELVHTRRTSGLTAAQWIADIRHFCALVGMRPNEIQVAVAADHVILRVMPDDERAPRPECPDVFRLRVITGWRLCRGIDPPDTWPDVPDAFMRPIERSWVIVTGDDRVVASYDDQGEAKAFARFFEPFLASAGIRDLWAAAQQTVGRCPGCNGTSRDILDADVDCNSCAPLRLALGNLFGGPYEC